MTAELLDKAPAALDKLAEKGNEAAIAAVTARLEHQDSNVRETAVKALPEVAEKSDEVAVAVVTARFEDRASDVREAAVSALPMLAEKDNEVAIAAVAADWKTGPVMSRKEPSVQYRCSPRKAMKWQSLQ